MDPRRVALMERGGTGGDLFRASAILTELADREQHAMRALTGIRVA